MGCTEASRGHRGFGYSEVTTGLSSGAIGCSVPAHPEREALPRRQHRDRR